MAVDIMRTLGIDNKHKAKHKTADAVTWTYAEGCLSHTSDGIGFTLSAVDTLALCNLLHSHYQEIVSYARSEQRTTEENASPKNKGYYSNYQRKKPS